MREARTRGRRGWALVLLVGSTLGIQAFAGCSRAASSSNPRIRVSTGAYLSDAIMFVGQDQGIFAAHGLDVEIVLLNRAAVALPMLAEGDIDVSSSGPLNPRSFNVIQRGGDLRIVAGRTVYTTGGCAHDAFVVRSDLLDSGRVTDPASLRGLRITTERTSSNYYYFSRLLALGGLTMKDVELIDMPVPSRGDAFAKGLVDVATATEPWATRIVGGGHARVWKQVGEVLPGHQSSFLLFGRRLLDGKQALGARFLAAYLEAARRLRVEGKSPRNVESIARWTRLDADELRRMCWPTPPTDPTPDRRTIDDFQRWALANHLIDAVSSYEQLVDLSFLDSLSPAERAGTGRG